MLLNLNFREHAKILSFGEKNIRPSSFKNANEPAYEEMPLILSQNQVLNIKSQLTLLRKRSALADFGLS